MFLINLLGLVADANKIVFFLSDQKIYTFLLWVNFTDLSLVHVNIGVVCILMNICPHLQKKKNKKQRNMSKKAVRSFHGILCAHVWLCRCVCAHASVVVYVFWCYCGVPAAVPASFVRPWVMRSCISVSRLCLSLLSVLSRGPAPLGPICPVLLIANHNAVTPWPFFETTGVEN